MRQYAKQSRLNIKTVLLKRLCAKSISVLEILMEKEYDYYEYIKDMKFLLFTNTNAYLDIVERAEGYVSFGIRTTEFLMKTCPDRIIKNFKLYCRLVHIPTFAKHLKKENSIKDFLLNIAIIHNPTPYNLVYFFKFNILKHFIDLIPVEERFEFVKKVFIDKIPESEQNTKENLDTIKRREFYSAVVNKKKVYDWYIFASFETAFVELKELIRTEEDLQEKYSILDVLVNCTKRDIRHIYALLKYYNEKHINDEIQYKEPFVNKVLSELDINKCDDGIWIILNKAFKSINVYDVSENESNKEKQKCVEFIIIYKLIRNDEIPDVIENKFKFNTLKLYQGKMNCLEKTKLFDYLLNFIQRKIEKHNITKEEDFKEAVFFMENALNLLKDWNKELHEYSFLMDKIRDLIKIKKENSWTYSLASVYNIKKSWRRCMFEESLDLSLSQDSCLNALKHDSTLLMRHQSRVDSLCTDNKVSMKRVLNKLRVYWSQTLVNDWKKAYLARLENSDQPKNYTALVRGLCTILPQKELTNMITKYSPKEAKINWNEADNNLLSLRRELAKNMHLSRPQPSPEILLPYCKGDYLQYSLPSLIAIFYNLNTTLSRQYIPKLLDAPVSLKKHGIRFAYSKLNPDEMKLVLADLWKNTKNATIRAIAFKHTHELLCKTKETEKVNDIWNLLEFFIDNLTFVEDKKIYELLSAIDKVPLCVKADYLMKSLKFFKSLLSATTKTEERLKYEWKFNGLVACCRDVMENLNTEFVLGLLQEFIDTNIFSFEMTSKCCPIKPYYHDFVPVLTAFILCSKNEEEQISKYELILAPLLKRSLAKWDHRAENVYVVRRHIQKILNKLSWDLKNYVFEKNMIIPTKIYKKWLTVLETLPVSENYVMLRKWKLTVALVNLLDINDKSDWDAACAKTVPEYGKLCLQYLKEDIEAYFPRIYILFKKALHEVFNDLFNENNKFEILKCMLADKDCIGAYLCTLKFLGNYIKDNSVEQQIQKTIEIHTSVEVKIHYYNKYKQEYFDINIIQAY